MNRTAENLPDLISGWSDLADLIEHFSYFNGHDWMFRGVTDATHGLLPKIGRAKVRKTKKIRGSKERVHVPYSYNDERAVLAMFQQQARAYLDSPPSGDLEWLAIAQHYGLQTRLLDWTDSLLVAAWFAVEEGGAKNTDSAIWVASGISSLAPDYDGDPFRIDAPTMYRPPHINPRISAQGSVLMICPKPTKELRLPFSKKIVIDRKVEFTIKKRLNACGINRRHLFPDLGGLAEHLAWMYKNNWLAGYKSGGSSQSLTADDDDQDEALG